LGDIAHPLEVNKMEVDEGTLFLLRRARLLSEEAELASASEEDVDVARAIVAETDGLPLALDQAGAYIEEKQRTLEEYLELFRAYKAELLKIRGELAADHVSVTVTFNLAFEKVAEKSAAAADLLRVCAFLAPNEIPEEIFSEGGEVLGDALSQAAQNTLELIEAIAEATRFSLISRNPQSKTLTIHRLVQEVLRAEMDEAEQRQWTSGVIEAVEKVFPSASDPKNWVQCDRLATHAQVAAQLMTDYELSFETAAKLLNATGYYFFNAQGRYEAAEPLCIQVLEMNQQLLGQSHPQVADSLNNLAALYSTQGRYKEAEPLYQQALEMNQQFLGKNHSQIAHSLDSLAELYRVQGRYEEAEPLFIQALEMRQQLLGKSHPNVAHSLDSLALLYESQRRYEEAEPLFIQALEMFRQHLGQSHPNVAGSLNNLALLYKSQGRYEAAESLYQQALEISQQLLGKSHPHVAIGLNNLAMLYSAQGRYEAAEPVFIQALEMRQQLFGQSHPYVANSLNSLAELYQAQRRYEDAKPFYQQALTICEQLLGPEHPTTQTVKRNLQILSLQIFLERKGSV
ncbi:MAG: tetratricopeptide repeat-containing protein, partial [Leptolyngbya sp. SIO1D8]|nr:tetratricopeptide repeat-containing protein [Leptolyngbya sp. SIO1D8]